MFDWNEMKNKIILADNKDIMKDIPDKFFELAIVDPPYGINMANGAHSNLKKLGNKDWDIQTPDNAYFSELFRVSENQIIWGGNYFSLMPCRGFIFWDKTPMPPSYAAGEYAWTSFNCNAKKWNGKTGNETSVQFRIHPTQKPVALYRWILSQYAKPGDKIIDTHSGSGSCAIACHLEKFDFLAIEKDEDYYKASVKRLEEIRSQGVLF
jgi:site-specific DNA-methyltransferase (adenine-specific)